MKNHLKSISCVNKKTLMVSFMALSLVACRDAVWVNGVRVHGPSNSDMQVEAKLIYKSGKSTTLRTNQGYSSHHLKHDVLELVKDIELSAYWNSQRNLPEGQSRKISIQTRIEMDQYQKIPFARATETKVLLNGKEFDAECDKGVVAAYDDDNIDINLESFSDLLSACKISESEKFNPEKIGFRDVGRATGFLATNYFSSSQESQMGQSFVTEFNINNAQYILNADHPTSRYVQDLMDQIARNSDRPDLKPTVFVINADVLNAFALPGGYVYVFRGLIDSCRSESELAGVMGHEWAHVTARHGTKNMSNTITTMLLLYSGAAITDALARSSDAEWDDIVGKVLVSVGGVYAQLNLLGLSRANESEADLLGSQYAMKAGFAPYGVSHMFEVFKEKSKNTPSVEELLSTHPSHDNRINDVYNWSAFVYPSVSSYVLSRPEFEIARQELNQLPRHSVDYSKMLALQFVETWNGLAKKQIRNETPSKDKN